MWKIGKNESGHVGIRQLRADYKSSCFLQAAHVRDCAGCSALVRERDAPSACSICVPVERGTEVRLATKNARSHEKNDVTKLVENAAFHSCALLRFLWLIPGCLVIELQQSTQRSQGNLFKLSVA
jgi:hypothetical protein